jgi:hypothetical protein
MPDPTFNLSYDFCQSPELVQKVRASKRYAQNLYAALCNTDWQYQDTWTVLTDQTWSCSWRSAGGIVADIEGQGGDYMDWYCSGMGGVVDHTTSPEEWQAQTGHVPEGTVTEEIENDLRSIGWICVDRP